MYFQYVICRINVLTKGAFSGIVNTYQERMFGLEICMDHFELVSDFTPQGDQPQAIEKLADGVKRGEKFQTLLGVTGSGKTFTMANIIAAVNII